MLQKVWQHRHFVLQIHYLPKLINLLVNERGKIN